MLRRRGVAFGAVRRRTVVRQRWDYLANGDRPLPEDLLMLARTDQSIPSKPEVVNLRTLLVQLI